MRFLAYLQNAYKLTNFTNAPKCNHACVANGLEQFYVRLYGSKSSGNSKFFKNKKLGKNSKRRIDKYKYGSVSKRKYSRSTSSITPIALISNAEHGHKFALIPVNLAQGKLDGEEAFKDALAISSVLRDNGRQIELFADNWTKIANFDTGVEKVEDDAAQTPDDETDTRPEMNPTLTEFEDHDKYNWTRDQMISKELQPKEKDMMNNQQKEEETLEVPFISFSTSAVGKAGTLKYQLPPKIEDELKKIPVSGMQLNFEMDMTNVKDALLNHHKLSVKPLNQKKAGQNLALSTDVHIGSSDVPTIPLHFNALINGTVNVNPNEFPKEKLNNLKVPEFNEHITAIAANLCSTALQRGFPTDVCRKLYSTDDNLSKNDAPQSANEKSDKMTYSAEDILTLFKRYDHIKQDVHIRETSGPSTEKSASEAILRVAATVSPVAKSKKSGDKKKSRSPHIVCVREGDKGCTSPGLTDNPEYTPKGAEEAAITESTKEGSFVKLNLLSCKLYKDAIKEAEKRRKILKQKSAKCGSKAKDTCKKSSGTSKCGSKKDDPCKKSSSTSKCGSKKADPCKKSSKTSTCGSNKSSGGSKCGSKKADPCKKSSKTSTCGSKKSAAKDPCKKSSKTSTCGSTKSSGGSKCGSKKADPCKKSSKTSTCGSKKSAANDPCKKSSKTSTCGSTKSSGGSKCGSKKADPCKKSSKTSTCGSKKSAAKDPCKKSSKTSTCGSTKSSGGSKCGSKKADPCKKSSKTSTCGSKKSAAKDPCKKSSKTSTCGSTKSSGGSKCGSKKADPCKKSSKTSTCGSKKSAAKDPCKKSSKTSTCGSTKSSGGSKCGSKKADPCKKSSKTSTCGSKKSAAKDPCKKSSKTSTCGSTKSSGASKCGSKKSDPCKKSSKTSTCGSKESAAKDPCKKSSSSSKCGSSASKCGSKKSSAKDSCKKSSSSSKCGSSASKCGSQKSSAKDSCKKSSSSSKCGSSASKCGSSKSSAKDPCKKSSSSSKCGSSASKCGSKKSSAKDSCKKSSSSSKCGSSASKCGSQKSSAKDSCKKSSSSSKCGSSASKCGSSKSSAKDPCKKSSSSSKCGSSASKCGSKQSSAKDSCKKSSSSSKCGSSASKCGSSKSSAKDPCKKSSSSSKCGSSASKCGSKQSSAKDPCKKSSSSSKCGSSASKCGSKSSAKDPCKKSSSSSKCGSSASKCGSKQSSAKDPCKKSSSSSKCGSSASKCGSKSSAKDPCKKSSSSSKCGSSASKCGSKQSSAKDPCKKSSASKCGSSASKCGSSASKCGSSASKCGSKSSVKDPCKKSSASKCGSSAKKCGSSASKCGSKKKDPCNKSSESACKRAENCKGSRKENPCKKKSSNSSCGSKGSDSKTKSNCGQAPRGDIRPKCKNKPNSSGKCMSTNTSKTKGMGNSTVKCAKEGCPVCNSKNKLHTFAPFESRIIVKSSSPALARTFSDGFPKESCKLSGTGKDIDYERRRSCKIGSWKDTNTRRKKRKPETIQPCYEPIDQCPNTACYKVFIKKQKENTHDNKKTLCRIEATQSFCPFLKPTCVSVFQKCHSSTAVRVNEEALIAAPYKLCTRPRRVPKMMDNDVLLKVDSVALSDSDIFMFETGGTKYKTTLGNEAAGIVEKVGKSVTHLKVGDHVVIEAGIPCGNCYLCKTGRYNLCYKMLFNCCLRKYCAHPAAFCHKMCACVPFEHAALVYQLASGFNACSRGRIKSDSNVVVIGSCATALCAAMCAKVMGAGQVCLLSDKQQSEDIAKEFITNKVQCYDSTMDEIIVAKSILESLGTRPDVIINCASCTKTMNAAIIALNPSGKCILCGFYSECASFNLVDTLIKEINIIPSFRSTNMFPVAIALLETGRVPMDCLLATCCKWDQLEGAFQTALSEANNGPRKVVVNCNTTSDNTQKKEKIK